MVSELKKSEIENMGVTFSGGYSISDPIPLVNTRRIFTDHDKKIAEVTNNDGYVAIFIFTDNQVNIVSPIHAKACKIESHGPILFKEECIADQYFEIQGVTVCFSKQLKSPIINLALTNTVAFLAPVHCEQGMTLFTKYLRLEDKSYIKFFDLYVQRIHQLGGAKTITNRLRLVAEQCEFAGELLVREQAFLAVKNLYLGDNKSQSTIDLRGEQYLHLIDATVYGDTQCFIKKSGDSKHSVLKCDKSLSIHAPAFVECDSTPVICETITCAGDLVASRTKVQTNKLTLSGLLELTVATLCVDTDCIVSELAKVITSKVQWTVTGLLSLYGTVDCTSTKIHAGNLQGYQSPLALSDCIVQSQGQLILHKDCEISRSALIGKEVRYKGLCSLTDTWTAGETITVISPSGAMQHCTFKSQYLVLEGGESAEKLNLLSCYIEVKLFTQRKHVTMSQSRVVGTYKDKISHGIDGNLELIKTDFIVPNQVAVSKNADFVAKDESRIESSFLWNNSTISLHNSVAVTDNLLQTYGVLQTDNGKLGVRNTAIIYGTTSFDNESKISFGDFFLNGNLALQNKSAFEIRDTIVTNEESKLESTASAIRTSKWVSLGQSKLVGSFLHANEMHIYDKFNVYDQSHVKAHTAFFIAPSGSASFEHSKLITQLVSNLKELKVENAQLHADDYYGFSKSQTQLVGATDVATSNLTLLGKMETVQTTAIPTINVEERLAVHSTAQIVGDSLIVEADVLDVAGVVEMKQDFVARGNRLECAGILYAANRMFLGFDKSVVNTGGISSTDLVINSNFFNIGFVSAKHSFSSAGFFGANFGLIFANNYSKQYLLSVNWGAALPNFSAEPRHIFSVNNMACVGRNLLTTMYPEYAGEINFAFMLPSIYQTGVGLRQLYLDQCHDLDTPMRTHEFMPIVGQLYSAATLGVSALNTLTAEPHPSTVSAKKVDFKTRLKNIDWNESARDFLENIAGTHTSTCFADFNQGISLAGNTSAKSYFHINNGIELSAFRHNIDAKFFCSSGYSKSLFMQDGQLMYQEIEETDEQEELEAFDEGAEETDHAPQENPDISEPEQTPDPQIIAAIDEKLQNNVEQLSAAKATLTELTKQEEQRNAENADIRRRIEIEESQLRNLESSLGKLKSAMSVKKTLKNPLKAAGKALQGTKNSVNDVNKKIEHCASEIDRLRTQLAKNIESSTAKAIDDTNALVKKLEHENVSHNLEKGIHSGLVKFDRELSTGLNKLGKHTKAGTKNLVKFIKGENKVSPAAIEKAFNKAGKDTSNEWKSLPPDVQKAIIVAACIAVGYGACYLALNAGCSVAFGVATNVGTQTVVANIVTYSVAGGVQVVPALAAVGTGYAAAIKFNEAQNSPVREIVDKSYDNKQYKDNPTKSNNNQSADTVPKPQSPGGNEQATVQPPVVEDDRQKPKKDPVKAVESAKKDAAKVGKAIAQDVKASYEKKASNIEKNRVKEQRSASKEAKADAAHKGEKHTNNKDRALRKEAKQKNTSEAKRATNVADKSDKVAKTLNTYGKINGMLNKPVDTVVSTALTDGAKALGDKMMSAAVNQGVGTTGNVVLHNLGAGVKFMGGTPAKIVTEVLLGADDANMGADHARFFKEVERRRVVENKTHQEVYEDMAKESQMRNDHQKEIREKFLRPTDQKLDDLARTVNEQAQPKIEMPTGPTPPIPK